MSWLQKFEYRPVESRSNRDSSSESDEDETKGFITGASIHHSKHYVISRRALVLVTALNVCFLLISAAFFGVWYYDTHIIVNSAYRRVAAYSPLLDRYPIEIKDVVINGTFFPPKDGGSIMRHQPNPADDKIWEEWELTRVYPVTREELTKMGKDWTTVAKLEDKDWGLGDNAYAAILDVYHQLHCLNSVRKVVYGGYCESTSNEK